MTIQEAIKILENMNSRISDEKTKKRLDGVILDVSQFFGNMYEINDMSIVEQINNANSSISCVNYLWVTHLHEMFLCLKHKSDCKEQLERQENKVDGETAQWWTTIIQGIIGVLSVIFTILFALGVMPNVFGVLGENQNSDALYYIIGTIGQQLVALGVAFIVGIINRSRNNKKYNGKSNSFEELLAVKYEKNPKLRYLLLPTSAQETDSHKCEEIAKLMTTILRENKIKIDELKINVQVGDHNTQYNQMCHLTSILFLLPIHNNYYRDYHP